MRRPPAFIRLLLIALGLVPIGVWLALASTLEPSGLGRSIGKAILVVVFPMPAGGAIMILGAALMGAKPRGGRIVATVGSVIVGLGALFFTAVWVRRFTGCGGPAGVCTPELLQALGLFGYALLHAAMIALIWRRRDSEVNEKFPPPRGAGTK